MPTTPAPKILVVRLSAMGDLVVTTPILRVLHEQLGSEVHLVTKAAFAPIVAHVPYISKLHLWSEGIVPALRSEGYDLVVDLHGSIRSHLLRIRLGVQTIGFRKRNVEKLLLSRGVDLLGTQHLVDRYFAALRPAGVVDDGRGLDYFPTAEETAAAQAHTGDFSEDYIAIVLGATHFTKRMPAELVAEVILRLGRPIVLLGGQDVLQLAAEVLTKVASRSGSGPGGEARVLDLCGALPLRHSIAVLAKAEAVIAGDTGLMHVAAALRKRMVVVWGNTAPSIGMYPYYPAGPQRMYRSAEVLGLGCRPCSRIGYAACPLGHFKCMREQRAGQIVSQMRELLSDGHVARATVGKRSGT